MENSYVKLFRSLKSWQWFAVNGMVHIWIYLLLNARYEDGYVYGVLVKKGQVITGRKKISRETGLSSQVIRTCLNRLKSTNEITIETTNKYSIITLIKWELYQCSEIKSNQQNNQQNNQQLTNKQPTDNQQITTKEEREERKKEKNDKDIVAKAPVISFNSLINDFSDNEELRESLKAYKEMRMGMKKGFTVNALKLSLNRLSKLTNNVEQQKLIVDQTIERVWATFYPLKENIPDKKNKFATDQAERERKLNMIFNDR